MSVLVYLYMFFLLFGPKYGFVDSRLILLPVGLLLSNGFILSNRTFRLSIIALIILFLYSLFLFILNDFRDPDFLRYFRGIISLLAMGLLFNSKKIGLQRILNSFFQVLLTNAIIMLLMLLFPSIKTLIYSFLNLEILHRYLRVTGLTAGYDIAGFITILCTVYAYTYYNETGRNRHLFFMILSASLTLFTSRGNMIYLSILFLFLLKSYFLNTTISLKKILFLFLLFLIAVVFIYKLILPVFTQTMISGHVENRTPENYKFLFKSYGYTDPVAMLKSFIKLPDSFMGIVFGASIIPRSDSGYIQTINAIGIIGLIFTLGFYYATYSNIRFFYKNIGPTITASVLPKVIMNSAMLIFFLSLVASIKNQYFFTRSVFEMFIFCSFVMEQTYREVCFEKNKSVLKT